MRTLVATAAVLISLLGAACGGTSPSPSTSTGAEPSAERALLTIEDPYKPDIVPADFGQPIDNPYFPLEPGTTFVYKGGEDGKEVNTVEVTDKTKEILGIDCVVVLDEVFVDGVLEEKTLDWYTQDTDGNVWYFGEYSKSYEDGKFVDAHGSWEAGVHGASPGIVMPAEPMVGDEYRQEFEKGNAEDVAKVLEIDATASVPYGSYDNVVVTEDLNPLEPKVIEHKYYAQGIGFILERMVKGGNETVELVKIR